MKKMLLALLIATCIPQHTKAMEYVWPTTQFVAGTYATLLCSLTLYDYIRLKGNNITQQTTRNKLLLMAIAGYINAHATISAGLYGIWGSNNA